MLVNLTKADYLLIYAELKNQYTEEYNAWKKKQDKAAESSASSE